MNINNLGEVVQLIGQHGPATITADALSAAIDLNDYEGDLVAVLQTLGSTGNADNTMDVTLHESDTSGGSYTLAAGTAFTQVGYNAASNQKISINSDALKRYVKFSFDVAGTTPSYSTSAALLGIKKQS